MPESPGAAAGMVPVRLGPPHDGLVVWHTREEYERLWARVELDGEVY